MGIKWEEIGAYKCLKDKGSVFITNVDKMITYAENILPQINCVFNNYTSHGIEHSKMVIKYMCDLVDDLNQLSELDLTIIIYCGLLHDIGMVVTEDEIKAIKSNKFILSKFKYERVYEKFNDEKVALQEIVRPIHGRKSKNFIINTMMNSEERQLFCIPNKTNIFFAEEVASVCMAHNEDFEWIKLNLSNDDVKGDYKLNCRFISLLLRIGDLLDIDETRTPQYLYDLIKPKGISNFEWGQHYVIENSDKINVNESTGLKEIVFYGESRNADIHRKILKYIDYINEEITRATVMTEKMTKEYLIKLKPVVINRIRTKSFNFSEFKLSLDYDAVTQLLMGENIYGDKKYGLREIIQNSIDACKLMREEAKNIDLYRRSQYRPYIRIEVDKDRNQVTIADNGIGMSLDILKKYFFNVGISYYSSNDYKFRGYEYEPIGNYGIGFLSCFMLSNKVQVLTKRFDEIKVNIVDMEKQSEYICLTQKEDIRTHGTDIILDYSQFLSVFKDINEIKMFIEENFINNDISITITEMTVPGSKDYECNMLSIKQETQCEGIIQLDKYLKDISGYMKVKLKNIKFIEKLSEISNEDTFIYDDELFENDIECCDEVRNLDISKYIEDNLIYYMDIPIIENKDSNEFLNIYEILEDYLDTLSKFDKYDSISIFAIKDEMQYGSDEVLDENENIVGNFSTRDLSKIVGHSRNVPVYVEMKKQFIIDIGTKKFLCYKVNDKEMLRYWPLNNTIKKVFVRDVLISNCRITIPIIIQDIDIQEYIFNIKSKNVIPDISRTNLNKETMTEINYAIGKALSLWIYDNIDMELEEKELIKKFIEVNYKENNMFLK